MDVKTDEPKMTEHQLSCGCVKRFYPPAPRNGDDLFCVLHDGAVSVLRKLGTVK